MAELKCRYCGGDVSAFPDNALGICERCGCTVTMPADSSPRRISMHNGANYYRRTGNFGKALTIYQNILKQDPMDAEASFGSALCRFGVEYTPTEDGFGPVCRRNDGGQFLECGDYLAAIAHSSGAVQLHYEKEGAAIARAQGAAVREPKAEEKQAPTSLLSKAFSLLSQEKWDEADALCDRALAMEPGNSTAALGKLLAELHCAQPKDLASCGTDFENSPNFALLMNTDDAELKKAVQGCLQRIRRQKQAAQLDDRYHKARAAMSTANGEQLHQLARVFQQMDGYRDSRELAKACLQKAEGLRREGIYRRAVQLQSQAQTSEEFRQAASLYAKIPGWKDANVRQVTCKQEIESIDSMEPKVSPLEHWLRNAVIAVALVIVLLVSGYLLFTKYILPQGQYDKAEALLQANEKELAIEGFQALGDFRDSRERALDIQQSWYAEGMELMGRGDKSHAAVIFGGLRDYEDSREKSRILWDTIVTPLHITAGGWYTAGILRNGTAAAIGNNQEKQCNLDGWYDLTSIGAGWSHTAGLKKDGTVITAGYNSDGRGSTESWENIVAIAVGQWHTVGLQTNGRVVAIGCVNDGRTDVGGWRDIIGISAGRHHTVGLRADGTAEAVGSNEFGQCELGSWNSLSALAAGGDHTLGLRLDGTVLAAGSNAEGQCGVNAWQDIISVAAGYYHSVGLRADGTVVATGYNEYGQCNVSDWTDIVAIAAGGWHTVGLKADGTVVTAGRNNEKQCDANSWSGLLLPGMQAEPVG